MTAAVQPRRTAPIETDALIVGAGPVGLFLAFQLGLREVGTQIVDALPEAGGQCLALYPDKPIYDIPALPVATGRELVARMVQQLAPFPIGWRFGQVVSAVAALPDGRLSVETTGSGLAASVRYLVRALVVAAGVGAFLPRTLKVPGLADFDGTQVHHHPDAAALDALPPDGDCVVVGGDAAALACALHWAAGARQRSVTVLHRRAALEAPAEALASFQALCATGQARLVVGQVRACHAAEGRLRALVVTPPEGDDLVLPVDQLAVCLGLVPQLGPLAGWGMALDRKQVVVETVGYATSVPGVHAVGDVATYPGKQKLIVCGFHEATLAAHAIAARLHPERPTTLQYTTTSAHLHRLLGVAAADRGAVAA